MEKLYLGTAGEYWVAACLLRLGFNVNVLPVDSGVDLLASRVRPNSTELEVFQIQVKTTAQPCGKFPFTPEKLDGFIESGVNVVVVSWPTDSVPQCVVFPPRLLHMMTSGGFRDPCAPFQMTGDRMNLKVEFHSDGNVYVRNRKNPFTPMLGRLDLIESTDEDPNALPSYATWSDVDGC
ncbi:MAG: hypothetical protein L6290_01760, partial [Thermodesulfovibrionales bacterium]|nr:hypothetical protein [Thermodesulfovibrionales bacterium]